jgi:hypothetical protein
LAQKKEWREERNINFWELLSAKYTQLLERSQVVAANCTSFLKQNLSHPSTTHFFSFPLSLFIFFASRPPFGGIADGAGGFAQRGHAALFGNDRK